MNPAGWKLVYAVAAVAIFALSAWEPMKPVAALMHSVAGGLVVVPFAQPKHTQ